jgi:hypothetical protein
MDYVSVEPKTESTLSKVAGDIYGTGKMILADPFEAIKTSFDFWKDVDAKLGEPLNRIYEGVQQSGQSTHVAIVENLPSPSQALTGLVEFLKWTAIILVSGLVVYVLVMFVSPVVSSLVAYV